MQFDNTLLQLDQLRGFASLQLFLQIRQVALKLLRVRPWQPHAVFEVAIDGPGQMGPYAAMLRAAQLRRYERRAPRTLVEPLLHQLPQHRVQNTAVAGVVDFNRRVDAMLDAGKRAVQAGTDVGKRAKAVMDAGELVSDAIVNAIVAERLDQPDAARGFILDGYPRTLVQADAVQAHEHLAEEVGESFESRPLTDFVPSPVNLSGRWARARR